MDFVDSVQALKDYNNPTIMVKGQHVGVYCEEYNSIDINTINEIMRDHSGKVISALVTGHKYVETFTS